jgi:hypothetical protein
MDKSKTSPITRTSRPQTTANTAITEAAIEYEIQTSNTRLWRNQKTTKHYKKKPRKKKTTKTRSQEGGGEKKQTLQITSTKN